MISGTDIFAFGGSQISRPTIEAYLATDYRVWGECPLMLRIGRRNAGLATLYGKHAVEAAAVITAWNPRSEPKTKPENAAAQDRLVAERDRKGLAHLLGEGADPTGQWPPEESRLVLGIDLADAATLGKQFEQNGIVWAGADAVPTLILLR